MRRTARISVAVHPVHNSRARAAMAALFAFLVFGPAAARQVIYAQACGGTETVLVESGASMLYRANLIPDDDVTLIEFDAGMRYIANASDPDLGMAPMNRSSQPSLS